MAWMKDLENETDHAGNFYISYCYWNANHDDMVAKLASTAFPEIYCDGDSSNGEYPIRVGKGNDSNMGIVSDMLMTTNYAPRPGYANHKGPDTCGIGGNHLYLDGHVQWKNVGEMEEVVHKYDSYMW